MDMPRAVIEVGMLAVLIGSACCNGLIPTKRGFGDLGERNEERIMTSYVVAQVSSLIPTRRDRRGKSERGRAILL